MQRPLSRNKLNPSADMEAQSTSAGWRTRLMLPYLEFSERKFTVISSSMNCNTVWRPTLDVDQFQSSLLSLWLLSSLLQLCQYASASVFALSVVLQWILHWLSLLSHRRSKIFLPHTRRSSLTSITYIHKSIQLDHCESSLDLHPMSLWCSLFLQCHRYIYRNCEWKPRDE